MTADRDPWPGRAVFALAVAAGAALVVAVFIEFATPPVRQSIVGALGAAFGAIVGVIALYVHHSRREGPA